MRLEAEAVLGLIQLSRTDIVKWTGSDVLDLESSRNPDTDRRKKVQALLTHGVYAYWSWTVIPGHRGQSRELGGGGCRFFLGCPR